MIVAVRSTSSFGTGGKVATNVTGQEYGSSFSHALAVQPDGKIVVVGSATNYEVHHLTFAIARYNPDGSLDERFGSGGSTVTPIEYQSGPGADEEALGVAVQPDGKIVAVGVAGAFPNRLRGGALHPRRPTATPPSGDGGIVRTDFGSRRHGALGGPSQPDGLYPVGGHRGRGQALSITISRWPATARTAALDPTFGLRAAKAAHHLREPAGGRSL